MYLCVDVYLFCILQCTYVDSSPHPSLCSLERMLLRSYVAYVRRLRVSSLGFTYICSPFERVLSGSYWAPQHVFVNWGCPLLGSYVAYVCRVGCHPGSSRVHIYVRRSRGSPRGPPGTYMSDSATAPIFDFPAGNALVASGSCTPVWIPFRPPHKHPHFSTFQNRGLLRILEETGADRAAEEGSLIGVDVYVTAGRSTRLDQSSKTGASKTGTGWNMGLWGGF